VYFTFRDLISGGTKNFTLVYNTFIDKFTSFYSFTPEIYINDGVNIWSPENNKLYRHKAGPFNTFHGTQFPSTCTLLINPDVNYTNGRPGNIKEESKVFDNFTAQFESYNSNNNSEPTDFFN